MRHMSSRFEPGAGLPISGPAPVALSVRKRTIDVLVSAVALALLAPLLLLVAIAIKLETRGPIFFRQQRTGLGGEPFTILKFRSMHVHRAEGTLRQASKNDSRVTVVGAALRALSLDEFPQLFNVLRGDMSLVGPRPHALQHDATWARAIPCYADRFRARPGLTGLAQVRGHRGEVSSTADIRARVQADIGYIDEWSLALDLRIFIRTLPLIFADPRAY